MMSGFDWCLGYCICREVSACQHYNDFNACDDADAKGWSKCRVMRSGDYSCSRWVIIIVVVNDGLNK